MRIYARTEVPAVVERLLADPFVADAIVADRTLPRSRGGPAPVPDMARRAAARWPPGARHRGALQPPVGGDRAPARRPRCLRGDPDGVGQVALLRPAGPAGGHRRSVRAGALPLPDQGARAGPAGRPARLRRAGRRGPRGRHLRRRHARAHPPDASAPPARSWSPTRTCSTRRSCPTTRSGTSSSSSSASSSSTRRTPTAASSAATSPTCCAGCCASARTTAATRSSSPARRPSATRRSWPSRSPAAGPALVDRNGAPAGREAHPRAQPAGPRRAPGHPRRRRCGLAERCALAFLRADRQTIVFGGSRHAVELMLTRLRDALREGRGPVSRVRGYRSGYLPTERRAIERGLRSGEVLGVVSTNALELGIDIGRLDAAVLAGYPGSIAATWQRIGRAGRRLEPSAAILVATSRPARPVRGRAPGPPLRVAARRKRASIRRTSTSCWRTCGRRPSSCPSSRASASGRTRPTTCSPSSARRATCARPPTDAGIGRARTSPPRRSRCASRRRSQRGHHRHRRGPASGHRRGRPLLRPDARPRGRHLPPRIAPVPRRSARLGRAQGLRPAGRRRLLHPSRAGGHAQAAGDASTQRRRPAASGCHGEVMVSSIATIYKKLRLETLENLGWGRIHLPEIELHTTAYWMALDPRRSPTGGATTSTSRSSAPAERCRPWPASCS